MLFYYWFLMTTLFFFWSKSEWIRFEKEKMIRDSFYWSHLSKEYEGLPTISLILVSCFWFILLPVLLASHLVQEIIKETKRES